MAGRAPRAVPTNAGASSLTMLITSAGRRVALMQAFRRAADVLGVKLRVLACDVAPQWSSACQLADHCCSVPPASDASYAEILQAICHAEGVGLLIPTIDPELAVLSATRGSFAAAGIYVAISDPDVIRIAADKLLTATTLGAGGIATPRSAPLGEMLKSADSWHWPVIIKPRQGSASRGVRTAYTAAELPLEEQEPMLVQELLVGEEYTVNIYIDQEGILRAVVPHRRLAVRAGEVEKGITVRHRVLEEIASRLVPIFPGARGALCFQAIVSPDGTACVFEINARFGGGYPLADHAGASFARWMIEERCGLARTARNDWTSGVTMLRYDDAVFL